MTREVVVPPERLQRWFAGFIERNGDVVQTASDGRSSTVITVRGGRAVLPDRAVHAGTLPELITELLGPGRAVVVLVRRGGFSVARAVYTGAGHEVLGSKTGTRYVQGRTAAGGQSQQRFARRRANQAAALAGAAAAAARTVLGDNPVPADLLVTGGDLPLLQDVLTSDPVRRVSAARTVHVQVGEPRRRTIDEALVTARSVRILVTNAADR